MGEMNEETSYRLYGVVLQSRFPFRYALEPVREAPDLRFVYHGVIAEADPPGQLVYDSVLKNESGRSVVRLFRSEREESIVFPGIAAFRCAADRIDAWAYEDGLEYLVEICLIGNVMSYWLERREISAIHASSVVVAGHAVSFIAGTSRGKTTTACSFLAAGYPLLTDDILPVTRGEHGTTAWPGYPQMKLLPQQLHFLGVDAQGLEKVHPAFEKLRVPIGADIGRYHDRPVPLGCFYLIDRTTDRHPTLHAVPQASALIELVKHSFAAELMDAVDRGPARLSRLAGIARTVPMRLMAVPDGYDRLSEIPGIIEEDSLKWSSSG